MVETTTVQMADHTVDHPEAVSCSCGENLPGGLIAHIASLMDVDVSGVRKALLAAHDNVEVNAGMCGGCDTCGSDAAMALCAICGEGYSPCPTYYAAIREDTQAARLNLGAYDRAFASAPVYRRNTLVEAHRIEQPQILATILADGTVETERLVPAGRWIITNPGGERYAVDAEKFGRIYSPVGPDGIFRATGEIRAFRSPVEGPIAVMAPWGELQYGNEGCYLAAECDEAGNPTEDRYIIGGREFADTYELKN